MTNSLQSAIDAFLDKMPKVFDPFAGGGAIPLEAARLGCKSYGNDINPGSPHHTKRQLRVSSKIWKTYNLH
jgi:putative DNA methylase